MPPSRSLLSQRAVLPARILTFMYQSTGIRFPTGPFESLAPIVVEGWSGNPRKKKIGQRTFAQATFKSGEDNITLITEEISVPTKDLAGNNKQVARFHIVDNYFNPDKTREVQPTDGTLWEDRTGRPLDPMNPDWLPGTAFDQLHKHFATRVEGVPFYIGGYEVCFSSIHNKIIGSQDISKELVVRAPINGRPHYHLLLSDLTLGEEVEVRPGSGDIDPFLNTARQLADSAIDERPDEFVGSDPYLDIGDRATRVANAKKASRAIAEAALNFGLPTNRAAESAAKFLSEYRERIPGLTVSPATEGSETGAQAGTSAEQQGVGGTDLSPVVLAVAGAVLATGELQHLDPGATKEAALGAVLVSRDDMAKKRIGDVRDYLKRSNDHENLDRSDLGPLISAVPVFAGRLFAGVDNDEARKEGIGAAESAIGLSRGAAIKLRQERSALLEQVDLVRDRRKNAITEYKRVLDNLEQNTPAQKRHAKDKASSFANWTKQMAVDDQNFQEWRRRHTAPSVEDIADLERRTTDLTLTDDPAADSDTSIGSNNSINNMLTRVQQLHSEYYELNKRAMRSYDKYDVGDAQLEKITSQDSSEKRRIMLDRIFDAILESKKLVPDSIELMLASGHAAMITMQLFNDKPENELNERIRQATDTIRLAALGGASWMEAERAATVAALYPNINTSVSPGKRNSQAESDEQTTALAIATLAAQACRPNSDNFDGAVVAVANILRSGAPISSIAKVMEAALDAPAPTVNEKTAVVGKFNANFSADGPKLGGTRILAREKRDPTFIPPGYRPIITDPVELEGADWIEGLSHIPMKVVGTLENKDRKYLIQMSVDGVDQWVEFDYDARKTKVAGTIKIVPQKMSEISVVGAVAKCPIAYNAISPRGGSGEYGTWSGEPQRARDVKEIYDTQLAELTRIAEVGNIKWGTLWQKVPYSVGESEVMKEVLDILKDFLDESVRDFICGVITRDAFKAKVNNIKSTVIDKIRLEKSDQQQRSVVYLWMQGVIGVVQLAYYVGSFTMSAIK